MLACRQVGASELTVLAWADKATVFGVTDKPECGHHCPGKIVEVIVQLFISQRFWSTLNIFKYFKLVTLRVLQGTIWYRTKIGKEINGFWGFMDGGNNITLSKHFIDNAFSDGEKRLSWTVNYYSGGGRCGTSRPLYYSQDFEKVLYHAN